MKDYDALVASQVLAAHRSAYVVIAGISDVGTAITHMAVPVIVLLAVLARSKRD